MKILIYGINFFPEEVGIGKYTKELADYFSSNNNEIRVITSNPYFPSWKVKNNQYKYESINNYKVFRSPIYVPKNPNGYKRIIHYLSFVFTSIPNLILQINWEPNIILVISPTILTSQNIFLAKFFFWKTSKTWLHIQDLEIDAAIKLNILKIGLFNFLLKNFETFIFNQFDGLSTISKEMEAQIQRSNINKKKITIIRNWADQQKINASLERKLLTKKFKKDLGINNNEIVVMYSGSLNKKQDLDILLFAIKECPINQNIRWILSIEGPSKKFIIDNIGNLKNVIIKNLHPSKTLLSWLEIADIHLLPQKKNADIFSMPSKLIGILASAKPVVASSYNITELGIIVNQVGITTPPGDKYKFLEGILKLASDESLRKKLGQNGIKLINKLYSKDDNLKNLLEAFKKLI